MSGFPERQQLRTLRHLPSGYDPLPAKPVRMSVNETHVTDPNKAKKACTEAKDLKDRKESFSRCVGFLSTQDRWSSSSVKWRCRFSRGPRLRYQLRE
jgi:hypothetical protein